MAWYHRVRNVLRPNRHWRELDEEVAFHVAERTDALIAAGMDPAEAAREAERRFGSRSRVKERTRDVDVVAWLETLVGDVRYALRGLVRSPGFAVVAVLSLGLGIGANTAIFSLTNALLLKTLPVRSPGELMAVEMGERRSGLANPLGELIRSSFTNPLWEAIRERQKVFSNVFAYSPGRYNLSAGGEARRVSGALVSGGFFSTLGVRPATGRVLEPADDYRGCAPVAVVSAGFARHEYGSEAAAVGRVLSLEGHPFPVVGVARAGFRGIQVGSSVDVYAPLCALEVVLGRGVLDRRSRWFLQVVGRLGPGVTEAQAAAALKAMSPGVFETTLSETWSDESQRSYLANTLTATEAATGLSQLRGRYRGALLTLMVVVGLVLLIACANIANLLIARSTAREHENAIRRAIGAGRGRLVRQLLTESLLLAFLGAAAGLVFSIWASRLLVRMLATGRNRVWLDLTLDWRVLAFSTAAAVATGLLFGLLPAWRAGRTNPDAVMRAGSRGILGAGSRNRAGRSLVVGQVALSLVLVTGAGLLLGTFYTLATLDPGFSRDGVLVVSANLRSAGLDSERIGPMRLELLRRLRALPGVASASASAVTPVSNSMIMESVEAPGFTPRGERDDLVFFNQVSHGYFTTMGTPILAGRDIAPSDGPGSAPVAVVTEAFVHKFLASGSPLGRTFRIRSGRTRSEPIEIVGVVGNAKYRSLTEEPPPTVFTPFGQNDDESTDLVFEVRGSRDPAALIPGVKKTAADVSPATILDFTTLADQLSESIARPRLLAMLSGFFGALALLLAVIGVYGTLAYAVTRRRGEIGMRMALGAARGRVLTMVAGEAGILVAIGLGIGAVLALATTRFLTSFLYGVTPGDPGTFAGAAAVLSAAAMAAALIPAWRAAHVEPMNTLRDDG